MDRVKDGGVGWRNNITPFLKDLGIIVLDPCNKPIDTGVEDIENRKLRKKLIQEGEYNKLAGKIKKLRAIDLRLVDNSDFLIVNLDLDVHACGTYEEIFWANRMKMPILIHVEQGKANCPHWLFGALPHQHIFSEWDHLKDYITLVDGYTYKVKTFNRWVFFNYKDM
jgi:hypothetical protein